MGHVMRKIISIVMLLGLLSVITACGGTEKEADKAVGTSGDSNTATETKDNQEVTDEVVTLNLWHIWAAETESSKEPFENAVAEFNAENPNIQIVVDATENETYKTKMTATIAANEAPDIYFYWSGGYMKNIVEAGKVLPLNDYLSSETMDKIVGGTLTNMTFDDKIYGLGHSLSVGTFFVNTALFDEYDVKIPETWDELITAIHTFNENDITPIAVGGKDTWCINMYLDIIGTREAGYEVCYEALTKQSSFVNDGIISAAGKLQELVDIGAFNNGALGISRDESEVPFYNGKVPMYFNGSWTIGNIRADDCVVKDDIAIVKFPILSEKSNINDFTGGVAETFVVDANTEYPKEAAYALQSISEKFSKNLYLSGAGIPTWKVEVDESQIDPLVLELVDLIEEADTFTLWWNTLLEGEDSQLYMNKSAELFAKQITPEEFVEALQTMNE